MCLIVLALPAEFTDALCPTQWVVADGKLSLKGEIEAASKAEKLEWKPQEEQIDAFGNVVKIKVRRDCSWLPESAVHFCIVQSVTAVSSTKHLLLCYLHRLVHIYCLC